MPPYLKTQRSAMLQLSFSLNLNRLIFLISLIDLLSCAVIIYGINYAEAKSCTKYQCKTPRIGDPDVKLEIVYQENDTQADYKYSKSKEVNLLSPVTKMAFLGNNDILLLSKNDCKVIRISNQTLSQPLIDLNVANKWERGLLGIAVSSNEDMVRVFLYHTESKSGDGSDICLTIFCSKSKEPIQNKLYRYDLVNNKLINPKLLFTGPKSNIASHIGGALELGPDNNLYIIIGDFHGYQININTLAQNYKKGSMPDGRAGILRFTQDGKPVGDGILGKNYPLNLYYAYGIRNGYGLDFDPVSGKLWDTENGPESGDEINLVNPGFNSGWNKIQGLVTARSLSDTGKNTLAEHLVDFGGKGKYRAPEFIWNQTAAPTALRFLDSTKLGKNYENDLFVASFNRGVIYHFDLNDDRTAIKLPRSYSTSSEGQFLKSLEFVQGIGKITDMQIAPDGNLYVLSIYFNKGTIFKISR
jgi:glucose/arabinose dehydrogenase